MKNISIESKNFFLTNNIVKTAPLQKTFKTDETTVTGLDQFTNAPSQTGDFDTFLTWSSKHAPRNSSPQNNNMGDPDQLQEFLQWSFDHDPRNKPESNIIPVDKIDMGDTKQLGEFLQGKVHVEKDFQQPAVKIPDIIEFDSFLTFPSKNEPVKAGIPEIDNNINMGDPHQLQEFLQWSFDHDPRNQPASNIIPVDKIDMKDPKQLGEFLQGKVHVEKGNLPHLHF